MLEPIVTGAKEIRANLLANKPDKPAKSEEAKFKSGGGDALLELFKDLHIIYKLLFGINQHLMFSLQEADELYKVFSVEKPAGNGEKQLTAEYVKEAKVIITAKKAKLVKGNVIPALTPVYWENLYGHIIPLDDYNLTGDMASPLNIKRAVREISLIHATDFDSVKDQLKAVAESYEKLSTGLLKSLDIGDSINTLSLFLSGMYSEMQNAYTGIAGKANCITCEKDFTEKLVSTGVAVNKVKEKAKVLLKERPVTEAKIAMIIDNKVLKTLEFLVTGALNKYKEMKAKKPATPAKSVVKNVLFDKDVKLASANEIASKIIKEARFKSEGGDALVQLYKDAQLMRKLIDAVRSMWYQSLEESGMLYQAFDIPKPPGTTEKELTIADTKEEPDVDATLDKFKCDTIFRQHMSIVNLYFYHQSYVELPNIDYKIDLKKSFKTPPCDSDTLKDDDGKCKLTERVLSTLSGILESQKLFKNIPNPVFAYFEKILVNENTPESIVKEISDIPALEKEKTDWEDMVKSYGASSAAQPASEYENIYKALKKSVKDMNEELSNIEQALIRILKALTELEISSDITRQFFKVHNLPLFPVKPGKSCKDPFCAIDSQYEDDKYYQYFLAFYESAQGMNAAMQQIFEIVQDMKYYTCVMGESLGSTSTDYESKVNDVKGFLQPFLNTLIRYQEHIAMYQILMKFIKEHKAKANEYKRNLACYAVKNGLTTLSCPPERENIPVDAKGQCKGHNNYEQLHPCSAKDCIDKVLVAGEDMLDAETKKVLEDLKKNVACYA